MGITKVNFNLEKLHSSPLRAHGFRAQMCVKGFVPLYGGEKEMINQMISEHTEHQWGSPILRQEHRRRKPVPAQ